MQGAIMAEAGGELSMEAEEVNSYVYLLRH